MLMHNPITYFTDIAKAENLVNLFNAEADDLFEVWKVEERGKFYVAACYDEVGLVGIL